MKPARSIASVAALISPSCNAASINSSVARCHELRSLNPSGNARMNAPASASVSSFVPSRMMIGRESLARQRSDITSGRLLARHAAALPGQPELLGLGGDVGGLAGAAEELGDLLERAAVRHGALEVLD